MNRCDYVIKSEPTESVRVVRSLQGSGRLRGKSYMVFQTGLPNTLNIESTSS